MLGSANINVNLIIFRKLITLTKMERRTNKKKLSKHLLEMKFMKRTREKTELQVNIYIISITVRGTKINLKFDNQYAPH